MILCFAKCKQNNNALLDNSQQDDLFSYQESDLAASSINERLVNANAEFAINIFKETSEENSENIFISPIDLSIDLAMANAFSIEALTIKELNEEYLKLIKSIQTCDSSLVLDIYNSIWLDTQFHLRESYKSNMQSFYLSEVASLDFYLTEAIDVINTWSNEKNKWSRTRSHR